MINRELPKTSGLSKALENGQLELALGLVPRIVDEYRYAEFLFTLQTIFIEYYRNQNELAIETTVKLVAKSECLTYVDWPQFIDLIAVLVGAIAEMPNRETRKTLLEAILIKLPLRDPYVFSEPSLNFNLACIYAAESDVKQMMEYVRRARFNFNEESFLREKCFQRYINEDFFREAIQNIDYTTCIWWKSLWPIEEWCEDFYCSG